MGAFNLTINDTTGAVGGNFNEDDGTDTGNFSGQRNGATIVLDDDLGDTTTLTVAGSSFSGTYSSDGETGTFSGSTGECPPAP